MATSSEGPSGGIGVEPIGTIRSPYRERADAPRQPSEARGVRGRLELRAGCGFEDALADLDGWTHLWALFWFHLAQDWRPKVQPPRSSSRRGVFATRAPHRPNPIGLSVYRIVAVEGLTVHVEDVDALDGTPLLDIKPYVAFTDAIVDSGGGWLAQESLEQRSPSDPGPRWSVSFDPQVTLAFAFLESEAVALREKVTERLRLGPHPHAYRRIRRDGDLGVLAIKAWRVDFRVCGREITVFGVRSGYKASALAKDDSPELALHRRFIAATGGHQGDS